MRFRAFDNLRTFTVVAQYLSFTAAASELSLTKGAVSYQISRLESTLGFAIFTRHKQGIELTAKGRRLLQKAQSTFSNLESEIDSLRKDDKNNNITIGMSTYFASRWLSPRLMHFITDHADIGLRLQPLIDLINLKHVDIDMAIRWGKGDWSNTNTRVELIFPCPAILSAGITAIKRIEKEGIEIAIQSLTLLHDHDESTAWRDWFEAAGLNYSSGKNTLVIPDPNVRVQAVIDNQGVALNDALVKNEAENGLVFFYQPVQLDNYGYYLVYPERTLEQPAQRAFRDWIMHTAQNIRSTPN